MRFDFGCGIEDEALRFRLTGFGCETKATLSSSTSVDVFRSRGDMVFVAEYGSSIQWKTNIDTSNDRNCFRLYCDGRWGILWHYTDC